MNKKVNVKINSRNIGDKLQNLPENTSEGSNRTVTKNKKKSRNRSRKTSSAKETRKFFMNRLANASSLGDVEALRSTIESMIELKLINNINELRLSFSGEFDGSLLRYACQFENTKIIKALIEMGAKVNSKEFQQHSPFLVACYFGYLNVVKILVKAKANIHKVDNKGANAVFLALESKNRASLVPYLVKQGVDINALRNDGKNPLHVACELGHSNAAEILINNGADLNAKTKDGSFPLMIACSNNNPKIVKLLLKNS